MKLNDVKPVIESSGEMAEQSFSIHDMGMIFDILRNKMYSNPIQAICREISCNARDAHREVKKSDVPCKIVLPNNLEPHFRVKDYGPGISPDRMANVFLKYTASTKRDDDLQTGGFGLGAKTPFSYSDSFTIETVVDGTKYNYICFIDESKVGKLNLMSTDTTTEPNSTEIIIPVKPSDFRFFSDGIEYVTRHWDVRPIVSGAAGFVWKDITPTLKGKNWSVAKGDNDHRRTVKLIIDGIEYPLDTVALKGYADTGVLDALYGTVYLNFGVGELSLQASREAVHLDKPTQAKIMARIEELRKEIKSSIQDTVNALPDLWSANCYTNNDLTKMFANTHFVGDLNYNGTPLFKGGIHMHDADVFVFTRGVYSKRSGNDPKKIGRSIKRTVTFLQNSVIYKNDLGIKDPSVKNVLKAFEDDDKLEYLYVVQPSEGIKKTNDEMYKEYKLDQFDIKMLSTITKQGKSYTISGVRLLVFKFDIASEAFKQVKYADMEDDTNQKVICSLERDAYNSKRRVILKNNKALNNDIVKSLLQSNPDASIYGVDDAIPADKVKEHFDDFTPIDDFIQDKVLKNQSIDYMRVKYAMRMTYSLNEKNLRSYPKFKTSVLDKDSIYLKNLELQLSIKEIMEKHGGILKIYESVNGTINDKEVDTYIAKNPDMSVEGMAATVKKTYPLLNHLDYYNQDKVLEPIVHYINLVDKELKNTNTI